MGSASNIKNLHLWITSHITRHHLRSTIKVNDIVISGQVWYNSNFLFYTRALLDIYAKHIVRLGIYFCLIIKQILKFFSIRYEYYKFNCSMKSKHNMETIQVHYDDYHRIDTPTIIPPPFSKTFWLKRKKITARNITKPSKNKQVNIQTHPITTENKNSQKINKHQSTILHILERE